jgi:serine/threonine protein kinase/TPR repeat protein/chaperone required for assembly of F1-ATPase
MIDCGSRRLLVYFLSAMPTAQRYHQYQLLRREDGSLWELGRGAMGITYKAFDTNLRFPVALKVINSTYLESDTARQRFLREARAAAALRHPNVASVFNLGTEEDKYFYVMEFIDGETVEARVKRRGPLEPVEALNIGLQVARALAVAARQQLVHRDLKPTNLMLVDQEGEQIVKVIDFGLAKVPKDSGEDSGALTVGGFVGTPHFASPEQIEEGEVDIRSDIYSLGVTLYFGLTGQSPFSGSVGQVMSQQLYKPLPLTPLAHLPRCVVSLLQHMMEKDPKNRLQTPQDLQKDILACLEEIRHLPPASAHQADETAGAFETIDLTSTSSQPPGVGAVLAQNYKLIEELAESPQGRSFLADDLRRGRRVSVLLLSPEFLSDRKRLTALEEAVRFARNSPQPMLREIYSLETVTDCTFLVQEHVIGPSMLDILRARSVLTAPEVVRLVSLLAPLADHASRHRLQHIDMTLLGIHLTDRVSTAIGIQPDLLRRPLTAWESLGAKVDAINFSFSASETEAWASPATRTPGAPADGSPGSYVRLLSLLAYELLGGPRARVDLTGQYTPVALLNREGNAVLRRGVVDECASADELARQLAGAVSVKSSASVASESSKRNNPEPLLEGLPRAVQRTPPPESIADVPLKRKPAGIGWRFLLTIGLIALAGTAAYLVFWYSQSQQMPALSIIGEPAGASILLDGKPPQALPSTFTHVPFGKHQVTAALDNYEPMKQDIEVRRGMAPQIRLQLKPTQEIAALSVLSEPAGAAILLDGKAPQAPPNTFTHVPFGTHQITATLGDYEPVRQNIEVRRGMAPQIRLQLKPTQEIAALSILSEPAGAAILLDGKPPQTPPNIFTHVPFGSHQITATLDDYEPLKQDIQVHRGMAPEVHLRLKPSQELAALSVISEPAGASILLDGKPPQTPPNTFTHVPFGSHQITATLDDYELIKQDIQVHRGMAPEVHLRLKPIQELAALSVISEPAGASILLDGKPPQTPPNTFTHVPFGSHQITATLDDYELIKQDIQVHRGMAPEVHLQLKPIQELAALSVISEPAGASILLDGKPPQTPSNTFTHVPFGTHQITATLDNYEPLKQDIQVRKGMSPEMRLQLNKADPVSVLLSELKKYDQGSPQYVSTYVRIAQLATTSAAPNAGNYRKELVRIIELLRTKVPPISKNEFTLYYKDSIKDASNLDVLPAIVWLAENEKTGEAFNLFLRAAKLGDSYAMMKLGRLYLRKGTEADDAEGFRWLNQAYSAPKPNLEAGAFVGDCYLSGKGVTQDVQKAEEIVMPLANQDVVPAMTLAGRILQYKADIKRAEAGGNASPQAQKKSEAQANELDRQARKWWERAEKEDWNASARLGKCYEEAWGGVEKNDAEAEKRYKGGTSHGNALSMFFYGLFLEKKPGRRSEVESLIAQAAAMGLPSAVKWCRENNVPFQEMKPDDVRQ